MIATSPAIAQAEDADRSPFLDFWRHFTANRGAVMGLCTVVALVLLAGFAGVIAPDSPIQMYDDALLRPPCWLAGGSLSHLLGTDALGRDILSRLIYGARFSLFIGFAVVVLALVVGISLGLTAGFFGGIVEIAILRASDIVQTWPSLLMAIVIVAIIGPSFFNTIIAVAVVQLPQFIRVTRASVAAELPKDYVTASRAMGAGTFRLMLLTVLPNCAPPLIVLSSLAMSSALLEAAALGFLGLGAQPPNPEWGAMLADARELISRAWWSVTMPGLVIFLTVIAFNLLGDGLRDALDPQLKR